MAIIGDIRKNSWILILGVGLGMGGFILMDMLQNQSRMGGRSNTIGTVNGKEISYNDFANKEQVRGNRGGDSYQNRQELWDYLVSESVINEEADQLGLGVSSPDLKDMLYGQNLSGIVYRAFRNPQTGAFGQEEINQIRQYHDQFVAGDERVNGAYMRDLEDQVATDGLGNKLNTLVSKALYTPTWMAEEANKRDNQTADLSFVKIPYDKIADSEVQVSDDEILGYMKNNKALFSQDEESRMLEYVTFDVTPTTVDSADIRGRITALADKFRAHQGSDSLFILENEGIYDTQYFMKDALSPVVKDQLFEAAIGTVVGPYLDNGYYKAVKLVDRRPVRDSVKIRQIFRPVENTKFNPAAVKAAIKFLKDSVETPLSNGGDFADLASRYSQSQDAASGGDVPMFSGNFPIPALRNKALYEAKPNSLNYVVTDNGVHLMEVEKIVDSGKTGVRVAYIEEVIVPSEETQNERYNEALQYLRDNRSLEVMRKSAEEKGMVLGQTNVFVNDYRLDDTQFPSGESSRDMIKWAFSANAGDVSADVYSFDDQIEFYDKQYLVTALAGVNPAGLQPLTSDISNPIKLKLTNQKKAEKLISQLAGKGIDNAASTFGVTSELAPGTNIQGGPTAGSLGTEPKVLAAAFSLTAGQESKPIAGDNGVYIVKMNTAPTVGGAPNIAEIRRQESQSVQRMLGGLGTGGGLIEALKKNADVSDNRKTFF